MNAKFGKLLRDLRISDGMTQKDVADILPISGGIQMVSNVEKGKCYYSKENLKLLCNKFQWNYRALRDLVIEEKCDKIRKDWR